MSVHSYFEIAHRADGSPFYRLIDGGPEWLHDAVMDAHDDELPNDWRYCTCAYIVSTIGERGDALTTDDSAEIADGLLDVSSADLARWLADVPARHSYIDEHVEMVGVLPNVFDMIRGGQYVAIEQMARQLIEAFLDHADELVQS